MRRFTHVLMCILNFPVTVSLINYYSFFFFFFFFKGTPRVVFIKLLKLENFVVLLMLVYPKLALIEV